MVRWRVISWASTTEKECAAASFSSSYVVWGLGPKNHTIYKRHMMPLGLMSGFRTHALSWWYQTVHRCANAFAVLLIS